MESPQTSTLNDTTPAALQIVFLEIEPRQSKLSETSLKIKKSEIVKNPKKSFRTYIDNKQTEIIANTAWYDAVKKSESEGE